MQMMVGAPARHRRSAGGRRGRRARRGDLSRLRRALQRRWWRRHDAGQRAAAAAADRRVDDRAARRTLGAEVAGGVDRRRARRRLPGHGLAQRVHRAARGRAPVELAHPHPRARGRARAVRFRRPRRKGAVPALLAVSGIGPRMALNILSGMPAADLLDALAAGNVARLVAVPGVGKGPRSAWSSSCRTACQQAQPRRAERCRRPRRICRGGFGAGQSGLPSAAKRSAPCARWPQRGQRARRGDPARAAEAERMIDDREPDAATGGRRGAPTTRPASTRRCARTTLEDYIGQESVESQPARRRSRRRAGAARASTTCCSTARPGSARRRWPTSSRARWASAALHVGPGDRAPGRSGRAAHQPRARRRAVHRRDPSPQPRRRGDPLSGDGGLPDRRDDRAGPVGALDQARPEAVHADRRDDARRPAHRAAAQPLRRQPAARLLPRRGAGRDRAALGARSSTWRSSRAAPSEIARRARGTPRIANRLLRRVRDFAQVRAEGIITPRWREQALALLEVDARGFDEMDRALLLTIIDKFGGGPVGVETLAAAIGEERDTIEDVYEPFLIQEGFLAPHAEGPRRDRRSPTSISAAPPRAPALRRASCSSDGRLGKMLMLSGPWPWCSAQCSSWAADCHGSAACPATSSSSAAQ